MAYRGASSRRSFGSKQPAKIEQLAAFKRLICGARDIDTLDPAMLARVHRLDAQTVEYELGVERRRRAEATA